MMMDDSNDNKNNKKSTPAFQPIPNVDVFASASSLNEAMDLRNVVAKHCEWPIIYEHLNGTYEVGGLTRSGGRVSDETLHTIVEALELHKNYKDNKSKKIKAKKVASSKTKKVDKKKNNKS